LYECENKEELHLSINLFYGIGVFIPVSNLEVSTLWYSTVLGFEITHNDPPEATVLKMNDEKVVFCLVKSVDISPMIFQKNNYDVNNYYNFHTLDIESAHKSLAEKGAEVTSIHQFGSMRGFSLYDPDGNMFGVIQ
jgi:predicted lactoylglutathione lyase